MKLYGELPNAKQIAQSIVKRRTENGERRAESAGILTTNDLKEAVEKHLPEAARTRRWQ